MPVLSESAIELLLGALLLALPWLPIVRPRTASLFSKAYKGSYAAAVLGERDWKKARFTVADATVPLLSLAGAVWMYMRPTADPVLSLGLLFVLLVLALFDIRFRRLPNGLTFPLAAAGPVAFATIGGDPLYSIATGLLAGGLLMGLAAAYRAWRGFDGLGMGDVKLIIAMGAWLGPLSLWHALLAAALLALALEWPRRRFPIGGRAVSPRIPFGVHLAAAFWLVWCLGPMHF
jgi:leader peptidase (prepilin peptidase)/N-methyltransferase